MEKLVNIFVDRWVNTLADKLIDQALKVSVPNNSNLDIEVALWKQEAPKWCKSYNFEVPNLTQNFPQKPPQSRKSTREAPKRLESLPLYR